MKIIIQSIIYLFIAIIGIATLVFVAFAVIPVDPARAVLGPQASQEAINALRSDYGLDEAIHIRYFRTMSHMARGDFGSSFFFEQPARSIVKELAPITLIRVSVALALGCIGGIIAAWASVAAGYIRWARSSFVFFHSIPSFCIMLVLLWCVSRGTGQTPLGSPSLYEFLAIIGAAMYPMGAVGLFVLERMSPIRGIPRHVEFLQMLGSPSNYVRSVLMRDAIPGVVAIVINAFSITLTAVSFAELIFGLRGFGVVYIRSCERGDLFVVMAGSVLLCILIILVQRIGDVVLRALDPRLAHHA